MSSGGWQATAAVVRTLHSKIGTVAAVFASGRVQLSTSTVIRRWLRRSERARRGSIPVQAGRAVDPRRQCLQKALQGRVLPLIGPLQQIGSELENVRCEAFSAVGSGFWEHLAVEDPGSRPHLMPASEAPTRAAVERVFKKQDAADDGLETVQKG